MVDDRQYRIDMDSAMEELAYVLYGVNGSRTSDPENVERAARMITMLKEMLIASGVQKSLLEAVIKTV